MVDANVLSLLWPRRQHQDTLIHTRLNWFITFQSFLFTAYAIAADKPGLEPFGWILPILGFLAGVFTWLSIMGLITFKRIRAKLGATLEKESTEQKSEYKKEENLDEPMSLEVKRSWYNHWLYVGFAGALFLPPLFTVAWIHIRLAVLPWTK